MNASEEGKRRTGREGEGAGAEQILRMSRGRLTRGEREGGRHQAERIYTTRSSCCHLQGKLPETELH